MTLREYGGTQCRWPTIQPSSNFSKKNDNFHNGIFLFEAWGYCGSWNPWENGPHKMAEARNTDKTAKLLHLSLSSSRSHFVQQMNDCLDLLKPAKLTQYRQCTIKSGVRDLTARNAIEDQLWERIYIFIFIFC